MTKAQEADRQDAIAKLRDWLPRDSTVYLVLRHVSRSGMRREIGAVVFKPDERRGLIDLHPNYAIAEALGWRRNKNGDGVIVDGCGMDMGFHLVYELARTLYGSGDALSHRWL